MLFLVFTLLLFIVLRAPSLFEPYWYGDEGIYQVIGMGMREGRAMYTQVWDNKPPLLFLVYALFSGEQQPIRILSLLFGVCSVVAFFFLSKRLLNEQKSIYLVTFVFSIVFATPILEGNIANTENFMLLPILVGMWFLITARGNLLLICVSGLLFSLAFLFKIVGLFDFCTAFCFLLFSKRLKQLVPLTAGFILPILLTTLYFSLTDRFNPFFRTVLTTNIGYVGYANHFIVPQGFLILKIVLLLCGLIFLAFWNRRKKQSDNEVFIYIWLLWSLFNVFFSGRNYTHYFLLLLPSACLLIGLFTKKILRFTAISKSAHYVFVIVLALVLVGRTGRTYRYYFNFAAHQTGSITENEYKEFFDPITVRNYHVVEYIRKNTSYDEQIFIWGNSAQIYKMTDKLPPGRFSVAYHIIASESTLKETEEALDLVQPTVIVILDDPQPYPYPLDGYQMKTIIGNSVVYERL